MNNTAQYLRLTYMNINEFIDLIKENSEKGERTEFMKLEFSIDDPRKDKPPGLEIQETFFVKYDSDQDAFSVYYPDTEKEELLSPEEVDHIFYSQRWGTCVHK